MVHCMSWHESHISEYTQYTSHYICVSNKSAFGPFYLTQKRPVYFHLNNFFIHLNNIWIYVIISLFVRTDAQQELLSPSSPYIPSSSFYKNKRQNVLCIFQSLEFVAETRILAEMKIKNRGKKFFPQKNKLTSILFFFLKTVCRCSRKYGNHAVNECEFASEIERWWSYRSWTFAYFKLFPWRKYTAGHDWSKKFVKPMNIDFAFEA